jgi:hypothetical protein
VRLISRGKPSHQQDERTKTAKHETSQHSFVLQQLTGQPDIQYRMDLTEDNIKALISKTGGLMANFLMWSMITTVDEGAGIYKNLEWLTETSYQDFRS